MLRRAIVSGLAIAALTTPAAHALTVPANDPFYAAPSDLASKQPGDVLRTRKITIAAAGVLPSLSGTQVLYRTTNQLGEPSATVATVIPSLVAGAQKLLSYQTAYDGLATTCRPSYTMQGGAPTATATLENSIMLSYVTQGYPVVTADYEGPTDDYGAGREEGLNTLDGIRAAQTVLGLPKSTPTGLLGYSGGSIASMWASEQAPDYAPELQIKGVAAGGIPVDFWHNLDYIGGTKDWAGAIPSITVGLASAYRLDTAKYMTDEALKTLADAAKGCLDPMKYPGTHFQDLLKPEYKDFKAVPQLAGLFNDTIMGRSAKPASPLLMGVGNKDGIGDGVMIAKDVQQLAYQYCQQGVNVDYKVYSGMDHIGALPGFESDALAFLGETINGQSHTGNCPSIQPGNTLDLVGVNTTPVTTAKLRLRSAKVTSRGIRVTVSASGGTLTKLTIQLKHGGLVKAKTTIARLTSKAKRVTLRVRGKRPTRGHYSLVVLVNKKRAATKAITVR